ncbi:mitochondrial import inner membrane translocase subunit TIM50-like [Oppia nitens]|uniref:mitochondrial import inner membrane translocase subunit TIM50-like n=1 Tax=Oppia nitens TaxID=1686743 RepID=UPI0023DAEA93|nr:mitochondrial import inner membrane translocase subunit TIM50-like [Oppia nitens]
MLSTMRLMSASSSSSSVIVKCLSKLVVGRNAVGVVGHHLRPNYRLLSSSTRCLQSSTTLLFNTNQTNDWLFCRLRQSDPLPMMTTTTTHKMMSMSTIAGDFGQQQQPNKETDNEKAEKEKQRIKQQKYTKYTLLVMFCMFCGSGVYALMEWGKPSIDADGNPIDDEFTGLPLPLQYAYRSWNTFTHYEQVLREPTRNLLLPPPLEAPYYQPPFTLVLEMTGVLVHPEWTYRTGWRFKKRPYVDYFLHQLATSGQFEIVVYTHEQGFTAFPLIDSLDPNGYIMYRLFRDSTRYENGVHLKDLNCLNRDLSKVIHIDWNSKACQLNKPNCLTLKKWDGNSDDRTLYDLSQFLRAIASEGVDDVRHVVDHYSQFDDPVEAFKDNQRKLAEQQQQLNETKQSTPSPTPLLANPLLSSWLRR